GAAIANTNGKIDHGDNEPEKPADRPGADRQEAYAHREANETQEQHHQMKAARRQAAMRQQHALEKRSARRFGGCHAGTHKAKISAEAGRRKAVRPNVNPPWPDLIRPPTSFIACASSSRRGCPGRARA